MKRATMLAFNLCSRRFDQFAVVDTRGAGGHTGHAAEALIKMPNPLGVHCGGALARHLHQVNAPAGRIHLFSPEHVSGQEGRQKPQCTHLSMMSAAGGWY